MKCIFIQYGQIGLMQMNDVAHGHFAKEIAKPGIFLAMPFFSYYSVHLIIIL
jgi:hypothetical protein